MQSCFRYYKTSRIIFLAKSKDLQLTTLNIKNTTSNTQNTTNLPLTINKRFLKLTLFNLDSP